MVFGTGQAIKNWLQAWLIDALDRFFVDVDISAGDISAGGQLELHDLHLRPSLLPPSVPLTLEVGTIQRVAIEVSLLKLSVKICVSGVRARLVPRAAPVDAADAIEQAAAAQLEAVRRALEAERERERSGGDGEQRARSSSSGDGIGLAGMFEYMLGRLIARLIHNISLSVDDVAIEMELAPPPVPSLAAAPPSEQPARAAAVLGLRLQAAHVLTTDSHWRPATDTEDDACMHKVVELIGLALFVEPCVASSAAGAAARASNPPTGAAPAAAGAADGSVTSTDETPRPDETPSPDETPPPPIEADEAARVVPGAPSAFARAIAAGGTAEGAAAATSSGPRKARGLPPDQPLTTSAWWHSRGGGSGGGGSGSGGGGSGSASSGEIGFAAHRWMLSPLTISARLKLDIRHLLHLKVAPRSTAQPRGTPAPTTALPPGRPTDRARDGAPETAPRFLVADVCCSPVLLAADEWQVSATECD
jgi:uncharacterized membrane protein YgcG